MAFPVVASRHDTGATGAVSSIAVNLSSVSVVGDLYVGIGRFAGSPTAINFPANWNLLKSLTQTGTTADQLRVFYKLLQAGDAEIGATSMTVTTTGGSVKAAIRVLRITGHHTTSAPEISADATGASTTPDPTSLSPSWGAEDTLWIWMGGWEGEQTSPPAANPTNYLNIGGANSGTAGAIETNCRVATAERDLNTVSEDPGSVTISVTDDWIAWVVGIRPAPAAVPGPALPPNYRKHGHSLRR